MEVPVKIETARHCDAALECGITAKENHDIPSPVQNKIDLSAVLSPAGTGSVGCSSSVLEPNLAHCSVKKAFIGTHSNAVLYAAFKRFFDITFSLVGLVLCCVPMSLIALAIVIESKGGAIFKQERLGLNGKPFTIYKFRSMRTDAEANGPQWATDNDPRCTKVGRFIRLVRLDELPQLFNILKGEMSFVGPRPERKCFYEEFEKFIPGFSDRLAVKPGLTGLAQIEGGYLLPPSQKIIYDREYIKERSIKLDFICMFKTIRIVLTKEGAR